MERITSLLNEYHMIEDVLIFWVIMASLFCGIAILQSMRTLIESWHQFMTRSLRKHIPLPTSPRIQIPLPTSPKRGGEEQDVSTST